MSTQRVIIAFSGALLLFAIVLWFALSRVESPSTEPEEPIQYPNQEETTVASSEPTVQYSNEHIQYHNVELPKTGGPSLR